jgi:uncharacterized protein YggU (UPF0235/DUF167 family)
MRLTIRVHPGSRHPGVGGTHDGAVVVRVREPAVDGRATEAALTAVADALAVPRRAVTLLSGATTRTKILDIPDASAPAAASLLNTG